MAFSPDGSLIATAGIGAPQIWDVVTRHIARKRIVAPVEAGRVRVVGN